MISMFASEFADDFEKNRDATWAALAPDVGSAISAGRRKVTWRWTSRSFDVVAFFSLDVQPRSPGREER